MDLRRLQGTSELIPMNVGILGLGIVGSRVAANYRAAGFPPIVWSRTKRDMEGFVDSPVLVAKQADVIQIFVNDATSLLAAMPANAQTAREHVSQIARPPRLTEHSTDRPTEMPTSRHSLKAPRHSIRASDDVFHGRTVMRGCDEYQSGSPVPRLLLPSESWDIT